MKIIILNIIIAIFLTVPCYAQKINESFIMEMIWQFNIPKIKTTLNYLDNNKNKYTEFEYFYYKSKLTEGLLRFYEVKDDHHQITITSENGIKITKQALKINPKSETSHILLSRFLAKTLSWHNIYSVGPMVLKEIELAEKYNPENPEVILARVNQYLYTPSQFGGNLDLAYKKLNDFIIKYPKNEDGRFNYAMACKMKGLQKQAIMNLQIIIKENPKNLSAKKELKNMGINSD